MKGYKIVRNIKGKHYSFSFLVDGELRVEYKYRKATFPNGGKPPLFVFDSLSHAMEAYRLYSDVDIYQCSYKEYKGLLTPNIIYCGVTPEGTVLADSVTLLKLVK
jgi:hypothetical protein